MFAEIPKCMVWKIEHISYLWYFATHRYDCGINIHVCRYQVDKHIRRLDGDLARFEAEIHFKETAGRRASMSGVFGVLCCGSGQWLREGLASTNCLTVIKLLSCKIF